METVWFDELPPYPVRSFTYHNEQVRAYTVSRVIVYNIYIYIYICKPLPKSSYTHYFKNDFWNKTKNFSFKMYFDTHRCTNNGKFCTRVTVVHLVIGHKTVAIPAMPTLNSEWYIVLHILQMSPTALSSSYEAMYLLWAKHKPSAPDGYGDKILYCVA
jgi:hypothetical protein